MEFDVFNCFAVNVLHIALVVYLAEYALLDY